MLVALTGASGFIGSYTAKSLHQAGHRVRALVRPSSRRDHIEPYVAAFQVGDFEDHVVINRLVAGCDAVIHNAADWSTLHSSNDENFHKNVLGSRRLLEATRAATSPGCSRATTERRKPPRRTIMALRSSSGVIRPIHREGRDRTIGAASGAGKAD